MCWFFSNLWIQPFLTLNLSAVLLIFFLRIMSPATEAVMRSCRILCHFGSRDCRRVVTSMLLACISVIDNDSNFTDLLLSKAIDTSFMICFHWQWWKIFCIHDLEYVIAVQFLLYCNRRSFRDITKLCDYIFCCLFGSTHLKLRIKFILNEL